MDCRWEEQLEQRFKSERNLNFSTMPGVASDDDYNCQKKKISRDPMSHRIIEKRRRDRMNNCLADLSSLIPSSFLKKQGRGRIEKTEIIEMTIKHLKQLQAHHCRVTNGCPGGLLTTEQTEINIDHYCLGYQECLSETLHFLVEIQVCYPGDPLCVQIMNHLQKHRERILKGRSRSPSKESESGVAKLRVTSPDGSLLDRASPLQSLCPSGRDGLAPTMGDGPVDVVPKTEGDSLFGSADLTMKSCSDAADVQMSEPCEAKPSFGKSQTNGHYPSQLREMLQNQSSQLHARGRSMSASCGSRPFSAASGTTKGAGGDSEVFKYKRNIKERFKADQRVMRVNWDEGSLGSVATEDSSVLEGERRFSEPMLEVPASVPRTLESLLTAGPGKCTSLDSVLPAILVERPGQAPSPASDLDKPGAVYHPTPQFYPSLKTPQNLHQASAQTLTPQDELPVFVLHPKGNFYVPMTIAAPLVRPYLSLVPDVVPQLLHHVGLAAFFWNSGDVKITAGDSGGVDAAGLGRCVGVQSREMPPALHPWSSMLGCT